MIPAHIRPNALLDQHFLVDQKVIDLIIKSASITSQDIVVDVGAGIGTITRHIPPCKKVIAIEIDSMLAEELEKIPDIQVMRGNALRELQNIDFTVLLSNLPYMISEPLLHLLFKKEFRCCIMLLPKRFTSSLLKAEGKLGYLAQNFFEMKVLQEVMPASYEPQPKIISCAVRFIRKPANLVQSMHLQSDKLVKNALRESLVQLYRLTKNESRELMVKMNLPELLLEQQVMYLEQADYESMQNALVSQKSLLSDKSPKYL